MAETEVTRAERLAATVYAGLGRCPICMWPLEKSADKGCVIGNCSYRPADERERSKLRVNRQNFADSVAKIAPELAEVRQQTAKGIAQKLREHAKDYPKPTRQILLMEVARIEREHEVK